MRPLGVVEADLSPIWSRIRIESLLLRRQTIRKSKFSEEQIIAILAEQEQGMATAEVCRRHGVSSATFYKWKAKFGGLDVSDARRLKVLGT